MYKRGECLLHDHALAVEERSIRSSGERVISARAMQFWLLLFGAIACVALSGATPVVKVTDEDPQVHHDIHKRQLEIVNAASGVSKCW